MSQDSCPKKKEEQHTESIVPSHKLLSWLKIRKACLIDGCTMIFVRKNLQTCLEYFGMLKVCLLFRFAPVSPWLQRWSCANASDEVGSKENIGVICVRPKVHYGADVWSENMTLWCSSIAPSVQINLPVWHFEKLARRILIPWKQQELLQVPVLFARVTSQIKSTQEQ